MSNAELPLARVSAAIHEGDTAILDLYIRGITGSWPEREREGKHAEPLTHGLQIGYGTVWLPRPRSRVACKLLGIIKTCWHRVGRPDGLSQSMAINQEADIARKILQS